LSEPSRSPGARRGLVLVLSSPSGAGKTTLSRSLIASEPDLTLSISVTTRARRASEAEGVHYLFRSERDFLRMRDDGELLEWAEVHGNHYGTPRARVEELLSQGRDVLFDIDWQGTLQLRQRMPDDLVAVFILPPSARELADRLRRRAEDDEPVIQCRLANAAEEIVHWREYDYVLINEDFDRTLLMLRAIVQAERFRQMRQLQLEGFVEGLRRDLSAPA
jgi:guanylate kinase